MRRARNGFVDIHHHVIYGLDDGAQTREMSEQMLTLAAQNGIRRIIATPHAEPGLKPFPLDLLTARLAEMQAWCDGQGLNIELLPGCEIFYTPQTVRMLRDGSIPTLAGSDYVLVEFMPDAPFRELRGAAKALTAAGYKPIFAHIERYRCLRRSSRVQQLRQEYHIKMQMNADTICRKHSLFSQIWVNRVIRRGFIDFAATDSHNVTTRPCRMKACYRALSEKFGKETATKLCISYPSRIE